MICQMRKHFLDYIRKPQTGFDSEIKYYAGVHRRILTEKKPESGKFWKTGHSISPRNVIYYESNGKNETDSMADLES